MSESKAPLGRTKATTPLPASVGAYFLQRARAAGYESPIEWLKATNKSGAEVQEEYRRARCEEDIARRSAGDGTLQDPLMTDVLCDPLRQPARSPSYINQLGGWIREKVKGWEEPSKSQRRGAGIGIRG